MMKIINNPFPINIFINDYVFKEGIFILNAKMYYYEYKKNNDTFVARELTKDENIAEMDLISRKLTFCRLSPETSDSEILLSSSYQMRLSEIHKEMSFFVSEPTKKYLKQIPQMRLFDYTKNLFEVRNIEKSIDFILEQKMSLKEIFDCSLNENIKFGMHISYDFDNMILEKPTWTKRF